MSTSSLPRCDLDSVKFSPGQHYSIRTLTDATKAGNALLEAGKPALELINLARPHHYIDVVATDGSSVTGENSCRVSAGLMFKDLNAKHFFGGSTELHMPDKFDIKCSIYCVKKRKKDRKANCQSVCPGADRDGRGEVVHDAEGVPMAGKLSTSQANVLTWLVKNASKRKREKGRVANNVTDLPFTYLFPLFAPSKKDIDAATCTDFSNCRHLGQMFHEHPNMLLSMFRNGLCGGLTKKGDFCTRRPEKLYCWQHVPPTNLADTRRWNTRRPVLDRRMDREIAEALFDAL